VTYTEACDWHATQQGLDPIAAALKAAGIPHTVDQTGGFVMLVHVPLDEGQGQHWLWLSPSDDDRVCVGEYWDCGDDYHGEGWTEWLGEQGHANPYADAVHSLDDLRAVVTEAAKAQRRCPWHADAKVVAS
jgi:hypothetical protein